MISPEQQSKRDIFIQNLNLAILDGDLTLEEAKEQVYAFRENELVAQVQLPWSYYV